MKTFSLTGWDELHAETSLSVSEVLFKGHALAPNKTACGLNRLLVGYIPLGAVLSVCQEDRVDPELRAYLDENRRHFDVVTEGMRSQLQLVAEGVSTLAGRLDRVEQNLREEILRSQRELSAMVKFSYAELDRKIQGLESRHRELEERVRRLESARS